MELVAFDAPDVENLASFYAALAGWEISAKGRRGGRPDR